MHQTCRECAGLDDRLPPPWSVDEQATSFVVRDETPGHKKTALLGAVFIRIPVLCGADIGNRDLSRSAVFLCIERDFLALGQTAHSSTLKRCGVDEHVLAATIRLNEAETLLVIVELHGALLHKLILLLM
jgi:hypothetical protein